MLQIIFKFNRTRFLVLLNMSSFILFTFIFSYNEYLIRQLFSNVYLLITLLLILISQEDVFDTYKKDVIKIRVSRDNRLYFYILYYEIILAIIYSTVSILLISIILFYKNCFDIGLILKFNFRMIAWSLFYTLIKHIFIMYIMNYKMSLIITSIIVITVRILTSYIYIPSGLSFFEVSIVDKFIFIINIILFIFVVFKCNKNPFEMEDYKNDQ